MAEVARKHPPDGDPPRKKLKVSDLPISQSKRAAIDNLAHTFRKKGEYDALKKQVLAQFEQHVSADSPADCLPIDC